MSDLFDPLVIGDITIKNRILMAPLTRMRSKQLGNIPYELNAEYYAQRASAGLIISEATQISQQGQGYPATPGIYSDDQVAGWKKVTDAVHAKDGKIFLQLWHVGRISHSSLQANGALPVAPSAIAPSGKVLTANWTQEPYEVPHALTVDEITDIISDYKLAAENAKKAGFDGVEVHSANGYLLDQFLQDGPNKRDDQYGGSIENRCRLLLQVVDAVVSVWGKGRVGVRFSPYGTFNDMSDSDPVKLFNYALAQMSDRGLAYVHVIEPRSTSAGGNDQVAEQLPSTSKLFRQAFKGVFLSAGGYDSQNAVEALASGDADAIVFGRLFISNPDLPERLKANAPLTHYDRSTFYGGTEKGYTDYQRREG
jgi:N-ethylmaleimide reductase